MTSGWKYETCPGCGYCNTDCACGGGSDSWCSRCSMFVLPPDKSYCDYYKEQQPECRFLKAAQRQGTR